MSNKQARALRRIEDIPRNRLRIGMCFYEIMYTSFFEHFLSIKGWADKGIHTTRSAYLPEGHNRIVREALKATDWDYILFLEQDTLPPLDILYHVELYQDPIIASLYFQREKPFQPIAYHDDGLNIHHLSPQELVPMLEKPGLYPADVVPMGCTAIHRSVFEHMRDAGVLWFDTQRRPDNGDLVSDDTYFCRQVRKLGYQPLISTATICKHRGQWDIDEHIYLSWFQRLLDTQEREAS